MTISIIILFNCIECNITLIRTKPEDNVPIINVMLLVWALNK